MAAKKRGRTVNEVKKYAIEIDKKRNLLKESLCPKKDVNSFFDINFNVMTLTNDEIADSIINMMKIKNII